MSWIESTIGRQRAVGCVVGSAVGDALGAPFEFGPAGAYSKAFPRPVLGGIGEMVGGGGFQWAPGQFTDDTEMAIIVAESLIACHGFDTDDQMTRFRAWGAKAKDVGNLTREVLGSHLPASEAAAAVLLARHGHHTAGNGSLMRVAPGAVYFASSGLEASVDAAHALSAITHADPMCQWAVAIVHQIVRLTLEGMDAVEAVDDVLLMLYDEGAEVYMPLLDPSWTPESGGPSNGSAMGALAQAVWALRRGDSFAEVITSVIDLGGDTDSVAAVAGALAGAKFGIQGIPSRWLTYVHGEVTGVDGRIKRYDQPALQQLALSLIGRPPTPDPVDESPLDPREIVPGLWAANRSGVRNASDDRAVVSLCRIDEPMRRPIRREVYLIDKDGDHNPSLPLVVDDVLDSIDAFLAEGRHVIVHCHGGRSRTGLILAAYLMRLGRSLDEAKELLAEKWIDAHFINAAFVEELDRRANIPDFSDRGIEKRLLAVGREDWNNLWAAYDEARSAETVWVEFHDRSETTMVDGIEQTIHFEGGTGYSEELVRLLEHLYDARVVLLGFDWTTWLQASPFSDGLRGVDFRELSLADVVRLITAIMRQDRFVDGQMGVSFEDGTLPQLLDIVRQWVEQSGRW